MRAGTRRRFKQTEIGMIPEDWEIVKLGDQIELCYGKGLTEAKRIRGNVPVFGSNGIVGFHNKFLAKGPGIIIGRKGSVGEVKFSKQDFWAIDTTYFVRLKKKGDIHFWYYFLLTLSLNKMNSHSAVPGLNRDNVYQIITRIPYFDEQRAIAEILSSLDDKIELNQQMNKTLEKIGQAIFKHWFVDFEFPDEEGRPYKSNGGEMVDSELGEIPKGWFDGRIKDICEINMGQSPNSKYYNDEGKGLPFYQGIKDFGFIFPQINVYCSNPTKKALSDDILFSVRAPVGEVNIAYQECCIGRGVAALRMKENKNFFLYYLLLWSKEELRQIYESEGTVFGCINKTGIENFRIVIPPNPLVGKFNDLVEANFKIAFVNFQEAVSLSRTRNSLLPKLMSGKIRVNMEAS